MQHQWRGLLKKGVLKLLLDLLNKYILLLAGKCSYILIVILHLAKQSLLQCIMPVMQQLGILKKTMGVEVMGYLEI